MQELTLPKLGQSMEEGTVVEWLIDKGGPVSEGDPILIFETEKTSSEITAAEDGKLLSKKVSEGETVSVGTVLGYVGSESDDVPEKTHSTTNGASGMEPSNTNRTSDTDGGSHGVEQKETTAESNSVPTPSAGASSTANFSRGTPSARRAAREHGADIEDVSRTLEINRVTERDVREYVDTAGSFDEVLGSPYARKVAAQNDVDITEVGQQLNTDRVRVNHVEQFLEGAEESPRDHEDSTPVVKADRPIDGAQKVMFDRMSQIASDYCSTTTVAKVDVTDLLALQERFAQAWKGEHDVEPSLTAFVTKAVAEQLPAYPELNAELVDDDTLRVFKDVNIGIAVNTDQGLLVPTIYNTASMTVRDLSTEIENLATRAKNADLSYEDMQNGTFTISNAGSLGTYMNTPKILPPQTGILGLCAVFEELELIDGEVTPRKKVHLCLTYDHRVVEGATAVGFVQSVGSMLESPESLLS